MAGKCVKHVSICYTVAATCTTVLNDEHTFWYIDKNINKTSELFYKLYTIKCNKIAQVDKKGGL